MNEYGEMKGITTWRNKKNGFFVLRLHYSADPTKDEKWLPLARAGYESQARWDREQEISFETQLGVAVFPEFDREVHYKSLDWNPGRKMLRGWDFGFRHPAVVFCQVDEDDQIQIFRAILEADLVIHDFAEVVKQASNKYFPNAEWEDYGDPAGRDASDKSRQSSIDILSELGIDVITQSRSNIPKGLEIIRWHLKIWPNGGTGLLLNPDESTDILLEGFEGAYHLNEDKENKTLSELPYKDGYYEHVFDAFRYVAVNTLKSVSPRPPEEERKPTYMDIRYRKLMFPKRRKGHLSSAHDMSTSRERGTAWQ